MTKEIDVPKGDFSRGEAEAVAAKQAEAPTHDHAAWTERAAKLAASSAASVARVKASGGGQA